MQLNFELLETCSVGIIVSQAEGSLKRQENPLASLKSRVISVLVYCQNKRFSTFNTVTVQQNQNILISYQMDLPILTDNGQIIKTEDTAAPVPTTVLKKCDCREVLFSLALSTAFHLALCSKTFKHICV